MIDSSQERQSKQNGVIRPLLYRMEHHSHCHGESHDHDHDHDHDATDLGPQDSLYARIDRSNVVALNAIQPGEVIIKPWDKRLDEIQVHRHAFVSRYPKLFMYCQFLESDTDDQMWVLQSL